MKIRIIDKSGLTKWTKSNKRYEGTRATWVSTGELSGRECQVWMERVHKSEVPI